MIYSTAYGFSRVSSRLRFGRWRGSLRLMANNASQRVALLTQLLSLVRP